MHNILFSQNIFNNLVEFNLSLIVGFAISLIFQPDIKNHPQARKQFFAVILLMNLFIVTTESYMNTFWSCIFAITATVFNSILVFGVIFAKRE